MERTILPYVKVDNPAIQKILEIRADFYRYAANNLKIRDKRGVIVPFVPNSIQRAIIDRVLELLAKGKPIRMIVLKARQMGLSTAIEAIIYWWTATHPNVQSMIIAHDSAGSKNIYRMFKRYYDNSAAPFQPNRKYDTKTDITFAKEPTKDNPSTGLQSTIKTGTAESTSVGRSDTLTIVHGSESAFWKDGEELVSSLFQTVPLMPETMIFLESTANNVGDYFHDEWTKAESGDSVFEPFFFPWFQMDEYELQPEKMTYSEEENMLLDLFKSKGIPKDRWDAKLTWRRYKLREMGGNIRKFNREYPYDPSVAFLSSGRPVFEPEAILHMRDKIREPKYYVLENKARVTYAEPVPTSPLKVWQEPLEGDKYVIGADVAEGLEDGDYSVATVIDVATLEVVARWRGHVDPDMFGKILFDLGMWYNEALVGVEINNNGISTVQKLRDLFYTNLYRRERGLDERFERATAKLGWKTDATTRPLMVNRLREVVREMTYKDPDTTFVSEATTFIYDDSNKPIAISGKHDDVIISAAIAVQMRDWSYVEDDGLQVFRPDKPTSRRISEKNKQKTW